MGDKRVTAAACTRTARWAALALALLPAHVADAIKPPPFPVSEAIHQRIEGDRSRVCVQQAARLAPGQVPELTTAHLCAGRRDDRPSMDARFEIGSISKGIRRRAGGRDGRTRRTALRRGAAQRRPTLAAAGVAGAMNLLGRFDALALQRATR
jgi:hypothetical protein